MSYRFRQLTIVGSATELGTHIAASSEILGNLDVVGETVLCELVARPFAIVSLLRDLHRTISQFRQCYHLIPSQPRTLIQGDPLSAFQLEHPDAGHLAM
jgi:hypothetical protein